MLEGSSRKEAQRRVDRIFAFRRELDDLAREEILVLAPEQRARLDEYLDGTLSDLAERFDVDVSDSQKRFSLGMRIVSTLGGLAFCIAVFLFFYRYWGMMTTPLQVGVLVAIPLAALAALELAARKEKTPYYTILIALVVVAAFVLNLTVLGSIFNLAPSQDAFLAWGAVALVLGYSYRLRLLLAVGLVGLAVYIAAGLVAWSGGYWTFVFDRPEGFLAAGLVLLIVSFAAGPLHRERGDFPAVYRITGWSLLFLSLLLLGNLGRLSYLPWTENGVKILYQSAGFAASAAAVWIGIRNDWTESVNLGSLFFAAYLFNRLFAWWWDWMPRYLLFLIIGIIALLLLAVFRKLRGGAMRLKTT